MGNISCCEDEKQLQSLELDTNYERSMNERLLKNSLNLSSSKIDFFFRPQKYSDEKTEKTIKIQCLIRRFISKLKFLNKIQKKRENLEIYFQHQGYLCERDDINYYTPIEIKDIEDKIKNRIGIYGKYYIPNDILHQISYKNIYSFLMPCVYLLEKDKRNESYDVNITSNTDTEKNSLLNQPIFKGYWSVDKLQNGYGILISTNGSKYEGLFRNGKLEGFGRSITSKGSFFEGNFLNGKANGYGIYIHSDGSLYKGEWIDDFPWGKGEEWSAEGDYYKGQFIKGKKTGKGEFKWNDGSTYIGDVLNNIIHGNGTYKWTDGRIYMGTWNENEMNGKGTLIYSDKTKFEGNFYKNKREGFGRFYYSNDKYYEGNWENGKQNGKGKLIKDGIAEEGIWKDGKKEK